MAACPRYDDDDSDDVNDDDDGNSVPVQMAACPSWGHYPNAEQRFHRSRHSPSLVQRAPQSDVHRDGGAGRVRD